MSLIAPLYLGTLNGKPLRFFKAPVQGTHLPWHVSDDLKLALDMPRSLRRAFQQQIRSSEWAKDVHTVATEAGIVTIAPHFMAQGIIGSKIDVGVATPATEIAYGKLLVEAWKLVTGDLPLQARMDLLMAALKQRGAS